jgi:putative spermidine/putrescine transport system permease protein
MSAGRVVSNRLILLVPAIVVLTILLITPVCILLSYSFAPGGSTRADFSEGLTLENYEAILGDFFYLSVILKTIWISVLVTAASLLIGWPLAYFLWRSSPRFKSLLTVAVVAPLLVSIPVRNYGWMVVLGDTGVANSALRWAGIIQRPLQLMFTEFAVIIGLTHVLMPFVVLSVLAALERVTPNLGEAAETLGANRVRAIWHIILPLSMPGILGGALLVFCVAVSAYVTPALMGPSGAKYAATLIYQQFISAFDWPRGSAVAAVLLSVTVLALVTALTGINRYYRHVLRSH